MFCLLYDIEVLLRVHLFDKNDAIDYARIRLNHLFLANFYKFYQRRCKRCTRKTFV